MSQDHSLQVFDETPVVGRTRNVEAWRRYTNSFLNRVAAAGGQVAIAGHTTGSHLGLSDEEEEKLTLIWVAGVDDGRVSSWQSLSHTEENQHRLGFDRV